MCAMAYTDTYGDKRLYILMGIPGTGKSTWAKRFFRPHQVVSSDLIREEKWPGESYQEDRNAEVFKTFHGHIEWLLRNNDWAVADATSLSLEARDYLRKIGGSYDAKVHLVVFTNQFQGRENNLKREACVPDDAMKHMIGKYNAAILDIKEERYDSITYINGVEEYDYLWANFRREHAGAGSGN